MKEGDKKLEEEIKWQYEGNCFPFNNIQRDSVELNNRQPSRKVTNLNIPLSGICFANISFCYQFRVFH